MHRRLFSLAAAATALLAAPGAAAAAEGDCTPWTMRTVASGLGSLENLEPDGRGGMLISASSRRAVERLTPDGKTSGVVSDVEAPGGLRVRGATLFFNTGDSSQSGALGRNDGTLDTVNLDTGVRSTYARGLTMPNGLVFLPNGDAVVSRSVGTGTGLTRVPVADPSQPQFRWADLDDTNGLAVDPTGTWLYVDETFTLESTVRRIRIADPRTIEVVARLGGGGVPKGLDDLTIDAAGILYITANGAGEVIRLDPATGASCVIAAGLRNPSAVKFGRGPGWPEANLYVSGFDGAVRELTPPAGSAPPPGPSPPPARARRIRLSASPRRVRTGRRTCVRFHARVGRRPLEGATVSFRQRTAASDARGRARICARFPRPDRYGAVARKAGLHRDKTIVRAVR